MLDEVKVASILSLDQPLPTEDGEVSALSESVVDEDAESVPDVVEWNEAKRVTRSLIQRLTQQERLVIALYYYEELTLREIGDVLGISESRVSQIHSRIILTLKGKLNALFEEARKS